MKGYCIRVGWECRKHLRDDPHSGFKRGLTNYTNDLVCTLLELVASTNPNYEQDAPFMVYSIVP